MKQYKISNQKRDLQENYILNKKIVIKPNN